MLDQDLEIVVGSCGELSFGESEVLYVPFLHLFQKLLELTCSSGIYPRWRVHVDPLDGGLIYRFSGKRYRYELVSSVSLTVYRTDGSIALMYLSGVSIGDQRVTIYNYSDLVMDVIDAEFGKLCEGVTRYIGSSIDSDIALMLEDLEPK